MVRDHRIFQRLRHLLDQMTRLHRDIDVALDDLSAERFAGQQVTVVVPDLTRPIDYTAHVVPLLERLQAVGAQPRVLAGIGLHRQMSDDEIAPLAEAAAEMGIRLDQHDATGGEVVEVAEDVSHGRPGWPRLPATYHRAVVETDLIVTVGTVEPHQYAGFSGGPKGVAIGCAGEATISAMHGLEFLRRKGTRLGATDENPFHMALWRLVDDLPPIFGLQIVPGSAELHEELGFGPVEEAFGAACDQARQRFFSRVDRPRDWFHLPVPDIKAANFYQASRAATYVALAERPAIGEGGTIVLEASCPEGIGTGSGEQACAEALARGRDVLLEELRSDRRIETRGGQQRAYVIALTLDRCDVVLVGAPEIEVLDAVGIEQYESFDEAQEELELAGIGETIEDVFHSVPILAAGS